LIKIIPRTFPKYSMKNLGKGKSQGTFPNTSEN
jgi:hypothetical protein